MLALVPFLWAVARFDWLCDDAYISFRYSRHLAEGAGLRFNPGETPPVEGYSNLLWVLALAGFERLGVALELASRVLTIASGVALLALVARTASLRIGLGFAGTLATALLFALLPTVAVWATSGLETLPFALALLVVFERLEADEVRSPGGRAASVGAGLAVAATVLLRADGALWAGIVIALAAGIGSPGRLAGRLRTVRGPALWLLGTFAAQLLGRWLYHDELLPNTAYAKAGFSTLRLERGLAYVASFALTVPVTLLVGLAALVAGGRHKPRLVWRSGLVVLFACAWAAYVGGDFMPMGRLLAPAMAFGALLFAWVLRCLGRAGAGGRAAAVLLAGAAILLASLSVLDVPLAPRAWRERLHFRWSSPRQLSEVAQWRAMKARMANWDRIARALALHTRPGETLVFGAVGVVGYRTELVLLDPLGLISPEVARRAAAPLRASPGHDRRVPPEFFLARRPDYLDAFVVQRDLPAHAGIRPEWRRADWFGRLRLERRALDPGQGFPEGLELRLLRLDWSG